MLYMDEIASCESRSIAGYISLIASTSELLALFLVHKLLKRLRRKKSSMLIFIAFGIRFFAPLNLSRTLQGIVYGICFGLGRGIGMLVAFFIYTRMKKRRLFLLYVVFNIVNAIIYSVSYLLTQQRKSSRTVLKIDHDGIPESVSTESGKLVLVK
ncbi:unnamed protein product [Rotaria sp. Silwood1]|nr:unnamed protein product [Rotaria sp. Silwood1]